MIPVPGQPAQPGKGDEEPRAAGRDEEPRTAGRDEEPRTAGRDEEMPVVTATDDGPRRGRSRDEDLFAERDEGDDERYGLPPDEEWHSPHRDEARHDPHRDEERHDPHSVEADGPMLPEQERQALAARLEQALASFIDDPHGSVEEAESVFERTSTQLTEHLARRRESIRGPWAGKPGEGDDHTAGTEELLSALRQYRDMVNRLLDF